MNRRLPISSWIQVGVCAILLGSLSNGTFASPADRGASPVPAHQPYSLAAARQNASAPVQNAPVQEPLDTKLDARLSQAVTVGVKNLSFSDLCRTLSAKMGLSLMADSAVAEDKITLFCKERPLADVLRQMGVLFDFTWQRDGSAPAFRYVLTQSDEARRREAVLRAQEDNSGLALLDKEMEPYRPYVGLTLDQLDNKLSTASGEEKERLRYFRNVLIVPATVYLGLSADGRAALLKGTPLLFTSRSGGSQALPTIVTQVLVEWFNRSTAQHFTDNKEDTQPRREAIRNAPDTTWILNMSLTHNRAGQFNFKYDVNVRVRSLQIDDELFSGGQPLRPADEASLNNAALNAALSGLPQMRKPVTLDLKPTGTIDERVWRGLGYYPDGKVVMPADVEEAIHNITGMDIMADSFAGASRVDLVNAQDKPLFDVLCRDSDRMRLRWSQQEGFLRFRNVRYYRQRMAEVPNRLLSRWAKARTERGALTIEEIAEIGHLTDAQLDSDAVAASAVAFYGLEEWALVLNPQLRPHWQFLGAVPSPLRLEAFTAKGLPYSKLPMKLERRFHELAWNSSTAHDQMPYRDLLRGSLRVEYKMPAHPQQTVSGNLHEAQAQGNENQSGITLKRRGPIEWDVKFIYTYGGPERGRWRRILGPHNMSTQEPGTFKE